MNVLIYIFDEVEVLDFAGPLEVFQTAARMAERINSAAPRIWDVHTIAARPGPVTARGRLVVTPTFVFGSEPKADILILPGGVVTAELANANVINWIRKQSQDAALTASICNGAMLLAECGLLDGKVATTHWEDVEELRKGYPAVQVHDAERFVDQGAVLTSAGISAGIDLSLHIVARTQGQQLAARTARQMDYSWEPMANYSYPS